MQTALAEFIRDTPAGTEAERILRACVHCGFCNATCPTYQLLGNELDGPRGRIYLVKQLLEGQRTSDKTLLHLDRCLTCRACETTCPSGVEYGRLADIGRAVAEEQVGRPWLDRLVRWGLRRVFPYPWRVRLAFAAARVAAPLLPERLREMVPPAPTRSAEAGEAPAGRPRSVVLLEGCVQAPARPEINAATARVLRRAGVDVVVAPGAGCCGALSHHLSAHEEAAGFMRRNVEAWWPAIEAGAEAVVVNASGCAAVVKDYGHLLREDPRIAERAARVSALTRDLAEVVRDLMAEDALPGGSPARADDPARRVAFHPPCTLQHAERLPGVVEAILRGLGLELTPFAEPHLCCGSAGTYSLLQPALAERLLDRKLGNIEAGAPEEILTANIGCLMHLQRRAEVPVRHWIEVVDERLADPPPARP